MKTLHKKASRWRSFTRKGIAVSAVLLLDATFFICLFGEAAIEIMIAIIKVIPCYLYRLVWGRPAEPLPRIQKWN